MDACIAWLGRADRSRAGRMMTAEHRNPSVSRGLLGVHLAGVTSLPPGRSVIVPNARLSTRCRSRERE